MKSCIDEKKEHINTLITNILDHYQNQGAPKNPADIDSISDDMSQLQEYVENTDYKEARRIVKNYLTTFHKTLNTDLEQLFYGINDDITAINASQQRIQEFKQQTRRKAYKR